MVHTAQLERRETTRKGTINRKKKTRICEEIQTTREARPKTRDKHVITHKELGAGIRNKRTGKG